MRDLSSLEKGFKTLEAAVVTRPKNDLERDGAIQRFKYTFELAWKSAKRILDQNGILSTSPRTVIRAMAQQGWIMDAEKRTSSRNT